MKIEKDKVVTLKFDVYDTDTNKMLESTDNDEPLAYIHGNELFIPKIEEALNGKDIGYKCQVSMTPDEGYGDYDKDLLVEFKKDDFKDYDELYVGMDFDVEMDDGEDETFIVTDIGDDIIKADGNHPFAGKNIRFDIEVIDVRDATQKELESGETDEENYN